MRAASSLPEPGAPVTRMRALVGRDAVDRLAQLVDGDGVADDAARLDGARLQVAHLALEARGLEGPLGDEDEPVRLEGLLDEVVGARA